MFLRAREPEGGRLTDACPRLAARGPHIGSYRGGSQGTLPRPSYGQHQLPGVSPPLQTTMVRIHNSPTTDEAAKETRDGMEKRGCWKACKMSCLFIILTNLVFVISVSAVIFNGGLDLLSLSH